MTTEEKIEEIQKLRPIDDVFFEVLASGEQGKGVCEEILRVIMNDDKLHVESVIVQSSEKNIYGRSVRLDALCILGTGERVDIEVQRSNNDDHLRRARFNASSITVKDSNAGETFKDVIDIYIIYISQFDIFKGKSSIYHIDKTVRETGEIIDDGEHSIFVNTATNDGSTVSELMECFLQKNVDNPKFPKLSSRVKELKTTKGGVAVVCEVMERYQEKAVFDAKIVTAIETATEYGANKAKVISTLMTKYGLSNTEANERYDRQMHTTTM